SARFRQLRRVPLQVELPQEHALLDVWPIPRAQACQPVAAQWSLGGQWSRRGSAEGQPQGQGRSGGWELQGQGRSGERRRRWPPWLSWRPRAVIRVIGARRAAGHPRPVHGGQAPGGGCGGPGGGGQAPAQSGPGLGHVAADSRWLEVSHLRLRRGGARELQRAGEGGPDQPPDVRGGPQGHAGGRGDVRTQLPGAAAAAQEGHRGSRGQQAPQE
ncbi:unnamed protein product, partial [Prorocentrum cordatum]